MGTEHADFLRRITENPEDDTARLVYADWLEENGQMDRAEFIRVQIEIANRPEADADLRPLHKRANALWYARSPDDPFWQPPFPVPGGVEFGEPLRGFVEEVCCQTPEAVRALSLDLVETSPVRTLRIVRFTNPLRLVDCRQLSAFRRIKLINSGVTEDHLRRLLDSPYLLNLVSLGLDHNRLTAAAAHHLVHSPVQGQLRELWFGGNVLRTAGVFVLSQRGVLPDLEALDVSNNDLDGRAVEYLSQVRHWRNLRHLDLRMNSLRTAPQARELRRAFPSQVRL